MTADLERKVTIEESTVSAYPERKVMRAEEADLSEVV